MIGKVIRSINKSDIAIKHSGKIGIIVNNICRISIIAGSIAKTGIAVKY